MASAMAGVRFVRCPKCDKVLAEFGQVPLYRCGGCGTVLRAKARASTAETTVTGPLEKDSQSPTESSSSSRNRSGSSANQTDTSLEVGNGMQMVAQSDHHRVPDSNAATDSNGKEEVERRHEESSSGVIAENLPEIGNQVRGMESLNEEEEEKSSYRADTKFTSLAYDASDSSRDEQPPPRRRFRHEKASSSDGGGAEKDTQPQPQTLERDTTFGSDDFHSVQNWMGSEIGDEDLITLSKDLLFRGADPPAKAGYSEPDHLKILRKVDELRDELREFLTKESEGKPRAALLPPRVPKVPIRDGDSEKRRKAETKTKKKKKQYLRPVCGGAPFVICYKCWTLLRLPADFLVSGKTLHRLQCGACSETLAFSFRPRARADPPRTPAEARHPPSEVDERRDGCARGSRSRSSSSSSELNEPVRNVSRSSSYSTKRLHRLMGYNSASDILFQQEGGRVDGGNGSSEASTPQFYRPPRDDRRRRYGRHGGAGASESPEIQEVGEPSPSHERSVTPRRRGSAALGLLKKGVREFSHGLENVKLKVHSRG